MKKLFLASIASNMLESFVCLTKCNPSMLTVAFVATAANPYENKSFADADRNKLIELGFKIREMDIASETPETIEERLDGVDVIFVAGGNTFYLQEKSISSGFHAIVKCLVEKRGTYYIWSSAGSVMAGKSIALVSTLDDPSKAPSLSNFDGIGLVDKMILPHFGNKKYEEKISMILQEYGDSKNEILKIADNQALYVEDGEVQVITL